MRWHYHKVNMYNKWGHVLLMVILALKIVLWPQNPVTHWWGLISANCLYQLAMAVASSYQNKGISIQSGNSAMKKRTEGHNMSLYQGRSKQVDNVQTPEGTGGPQLNWTPKTTIGLGCPHCSLSICTMGGQNVGYSFIIHNLY